MKINFKLSALALSILTCTITNAEYIVKVPLEVARGGSLPNESISFVTAPTNGGNTTTPTIPEVQPEPEPEIEPEDPNKNWNVIATKTAGFCSNEGTVLGNYSTATKYNAGSFFTPSNACGFKAISTNRIAFAYAGSEYYSMFFPYYQMTSPTQIQADVDGIEVNCTRASNSTPFMSFDHEARKVQSVSITYNCFPSFAANPNELKIKW